MPLRVFCSVLALFLCTNALTVYFFSHSIRQVIVATLVGCLLLQVAYFGSVIFLIWRSSCDQRDAQRSEHFRKCQTARHRSPPAP
ncbi:MULTISPECIES: exopolysaccharide production repressor protein [unclassified Sinorhizobium]|uniref:exopolysaccharide production repressor protein n=1 Tax=unclassified Sinorhizobium TaxID=2613772 RepID=UPI0024C3DA10|nr:MULTISPECIES: exopolysaccharide production repressor protein [unclassified Sinorhizobium]MDK1378634.1 exopolysaccharide production repressor protein [Sinorhizobium sp. 6-70]MDK1482541.1 exopolysaccharide production repressor protein [Sinorhizobium sp. 6-117]